MNMTETYPTTVLVSVEPSALNTVTQQVTTIKGVAFLTQVTGRFDLVIQLNTNDVQQIYPLVNQIRAISGVLSTRTMVPVSGFSNGKNYVTGSPLAFLLLGVEGQTQNILHNLQSLPHILNATVVPGEFDVIATIYGKDYNEIYSQVLQIAQIQGISTSETLFAFKPVWA
jgi:DNA-binding Lrp family transcriptional regulator